MQKATKLNRKKVAISHGLELYSYLLTRNSRKTKFLYDFEKYYISKNCDIKKCKTDEKDLIALDVGKCELKSKKIIQLT